MTKRRSLIISCLVLLLVTACSANRAYRLAQAAEQQGDWDQAVLHYLELLDQSPERVTYRTGLLRAKIRASQRHFESGKKFQEANALDRALAEYQQAVQLDPSNQYAQVELEKLRDQLLRADKAGYVETLEDLKEKNRGSRPQPPVLNPRSQEPISLEFPKAVSVFDIYKAMGTAFGINILFDPKLRDQQIAIELRDVVAQDALEILMRTANHFYKVLDEQSIIVAEDSPQNRRNYEDLVIQTFFLSNAEVKEVMTMLRSLVGAKNVASNDQLNAIVLRDTADKVKVAERIIHTNDKARGEVVIDVELLQVNGNKVRELGVQLSQNQLIQSFDSGDGTGNVRVSDLEFINQGNWFVTVPNITYNFLKNSSDAELLASPQIRISDGEEATLHIGDRIPIPVTSFNSGNLSGTQVVPITSFQYQDIGIRLDLKPRIHHNKEISLELQVEVSDLNGFIEGSGGQNQPIIGTRTIESTIRLKNGETNFLAGLIQTRETSSESGVPGLSDIPVLGRLFSNKRTDRTRTDLVLTLTPHIIRTPDITEEDLLPIWVGTEANITFRGGSPRVESEVEGPFDEDSGTDAERIREMIRRRIQNLPRGLQREGQQEEEEEAPPGVDLAPSAAPGDVFGRDAQDEEGDGFEDDEDDDGSVASRSLFIVPNAFGEVGGEATDLAARSAIVATESAIAPSVRGLRLLLEPETADVSVGEIFEVEILAESSTPLAHLPLTLTFDPAIVEFVRLRAGRFLGGDGSAEVFASPPVSGAVVVGASRARGLEGVTGRGSVATAVFRAKAPGRTRFDLARVNPLDAELQAVAPVQTWGASATVNSGAGAARPVARSEDERLPSPGSRRR